MLILNHWLVGQMPEQYTQHKEIRHMQALSTVSTRHSQHKAPGTLNSHHTALYALSITGLCTRNQRWARATFFLSPQPQFRNLKEALPQLLKKCCSATATPQSQFFWSPQHTNPQLESFTSAIFGIFLAMELGLFINKKSEVKYLVQLSL